MTMPSQLTTRDTDGSNPMIPPAILRGICERTDLKAQVMRDEAREALPSSRMSYEELAREMRDEHRADRAAGHDWANI